MGQPGRQFTAGTGYRYGFNGKENDNEIKGEGNQQDYGMRIYDPRLGRFLSLDPIAGEYPELSPYQFSHNSPVSLIDLDGAEGAYRAPDGTIHLNTYGPSDNLRTPPIPSNSTPLWGFHRGIGADAMHKIAEGISLLLDYIPILGNIKGALEGIFGYDVTGNKLSPEERSLGLIPYLKSPKKLSAIMSVAKATDKTDEVNDLIKRANKIENAKSTEKSLVKNKNSKDAEGDFVLYDVYEQPGKKGTLLKVGKADAERINAAGRPVRMRASERAARKSGYPNATATVRKKLGKTTTGQATDLEAAEIISERSKGNKLPLNKERAKKYKG